MSPKSQVGGLKGKNKWGARNWMWAEHKHICCCSVAQSCPTLCDPMDCSTPGFPVLHHLLEFAQTHVHWVGDAIWPSHPLLLPSPFAFNLSQHQHLFLLCKPVITVSHLIRDHRWKKDHNLRVLHQPSDCSPFRAQEVFLWALYLYIKLRDVFPQKPCLRKIIK